MSILRTLFTLALAIGAVISGSSRELQAMSKNAPILTNTPPGGDSDGATCVG